MDEPKAWRTAADLGEDRVVVYVNGIWLNRPRRLPTYLPSNRKMEKVLERLAGYPDSWFLGYQPALMWLRGGGAIQCWRSLEDLRRFAADPADLHVPAWGWLERVLGSDDAVGYWAECYVLPPGYIEMLYRTVEGRGLGAAVGVVPADLRERRLGILRMGSPPTNRTESAVER
jgi:hypothetical protein